MALSSQIAAEVKRKAVAGIPLTSPTAEMTGYYNTNLKTIVDGLVQDMSDVKMTSSINARAVAEIANACEFGSGRCPASLLWG